MASLVLGAIGGYFFGPIGFMIGSAIGTLLTPQKGQEGPRLSDLKLQTSAYGSMLPIMYGTVRTSGQVIWQTDLVEHKQKSGGKGGPVVTTYSYTCSFAVALCEGPIVTVTRIWADSRLIYKGAANDPNIVPLPMKLYYGDELQLPDPTIQADKGAANVNANRGVAYVVFTNLDMTPFGNRIPNLTFEIIATQNAKLNRINTFASNPFAGSANSPSPCGVRYDGQSFFVSKYTGQDNGLTYAEDQYDGNGNFVANNITLNVPVPNIDAYHTTWLYPVSSVVNCAAAIVQSWYYDGNHKFNWVYQGVVCSPDVSAATRGLPSGSPGSYSSLGYIYTVGGGGIATIFRWDAPNGVPTGAISATYTIPASPPGSTNLFYDQMYNVTTCPEDGSVWLVGGLQYGKHPLLVHLDKDLNVITKWESGDPRTPADLSSGNASFCFPPGYLATASEALTDHYLLYSIDAGGNFTLLDSIPHPGLYFPLYLGGLLFVGSDGLIQIGQGTTLGAIVQDLSCGTATKVRAGLATSQTDVSQLPDIVLGYTIANQAPVRSAIQPLQAAFFFDAVESDLLVKFVKRGSAPVGTILTADLGAAPAGSKPTPVLTTVRAQEQDLPATVSVTYYNVDSDDQQNTQLSRRQVTNSQLTANLNLPIVMNDQKGKSIADVTILAAWREREAFTIYTARNWAFLEPCDVVTVNGLTMRLLTREEAVGGVIKWEGVATMSQMYVSTAPKSVGTLVAPGGGPAQPPGAPPGVPPIVPPTKMLALDIPLISDSDAAYGFYLASDPTTSPATGVGWPGCAIFRSYDGGSTYNQIATNNNNDTWGTAATKLPDFFGGNVFDESSTVSVVLAPGSVALSGKTAANVLGGANMALLGKEIIQYKNAVLTGVNTYLLSGLLRGRKGTEWATSTHAIGEQFVALPTSLNIADPWMDVGSPLRYKAVTSGQPIANAASVQFTNTGNALKCYAPTLLAGGRNASQDIVLQWTRRSRIGGDLNSVTFQDPPMVEAQEGYLVQIYANSIYLSVKRQIIVTGSGVETATYTVAQQTTDFGGAQATIYWDVAQLGALGYGTAARGVT